MTAKRCRARLALSNALARSGMGLTFLMAPFTQRLIEFYGWQGIKIPTLLTPPTRKRQNPFLWQSFLCGQCKLRPALERPFPAAPALSNPRQKRELACLYQAGAVMTAKRCRARLALSNALARSGMGLTFLMAPFTQRLIEFYGWQGTLLIFGGIMLNLVPSSMLLWPDPEIPDGCSDGSTHGELQPHSAEEAPTTEKLVMSHGSDAANPSGRFQKPSPEATRSCRSLPGTTKEPSQPLLDFSPLKDPVFFIFTWSFLFSHLAYFVPFFHLVARARTLGMSSRDGSYLIAVAGITEMLSQLLSGWVADHNWTKKYHFHVTYLLLSGVTNLLGPLATTFPLLLTYTVAFALFCGGFMALVLPVLVDLVGVEKLHSYLGFAAFFAGIAAMGGPPLAGWLYDYTQTYVCSFLFAGACALISPISFFFEPSAQRWKLKKASLNKNPRSG
uniref:Solute carrier family 16 member 4 n=1 Tax=Malurus cyaneus samueli TaxID=2593467 RepID=A0A8C5X7H7_9PASS